jgi:hypothetical protein
MDTLLIDTLLVGEKSGARLPSVSRVRGGVWMKAPKMLSTDQFLRILLLTLFACCSLLLSAQNQGDNIVYGADGVLSHSSAFIDAASFCTSTRCLSDDFCSVLASALAKVPVNGGVVDARGVVPPPGSSGSSSCASNPFSGLTNPSTVLLPAARIIINQTWVLPDRTRIIGVSSPGGASTALVAASTLTGSMIEMGGQPPFCPGSSTGVSVEHLRLDSTANTGANVIHNGCSQDLSYVNDVSMIVSTTATGTTGLLVDGNAANSGPYTNLSFSANGIGTCLPCSGGLCTACVKLQVQTRGLNVITCTGDQELSCTRGSMSAAGDAAIYVQASNNSIKNVHVEGFWDAVEVGDSANVQNIVLSNIAGGSSGFGPVTNTVHLCGPNSNQTGVYGPCDFNGGTVSDVTILNAVNASNQCRAVIQDDVTGSTVGLTAQPPNTRYVGSYVLGDKIGGGYSRFTTSPSVQATNNTCSGQSFEVTDVPTWQVGSTTPGNSCTTPGAVYSNTAGTVGSSVYVCTNATPNVWAPLF